MILTTSIVAVIGLAIALYLVFGRSKKTKQVVLVGVTDSGKTKLFYNLVTHELVSTVTSQARNEFLLRVGDRFINLIDMPGHPRVRTEVMNTVKTCDVILFVLDSATVLKEQMMNHISNLLYDILSLEEVIKRKLPVLVVCGKSDMVGARDPDVVREEMEKEFDYIRKNRLQSNYVGNGEEEQLFLGDENEEFTFAQIRNPVDFVACSVNSNNTSEVMAYLEKIAK